MPQTPSPTRRELITETTLSRAGCSARGPALSQSQETAVTNVQRRWRGLTRRVHVLRKWSWVVSNGLEHQEEQRMVELGLFVESIAQELEPGPSLERRSTSEHNSLVSGLKSLVGGSEQRLTSGSKPEATAPK